MTRLFVFLSIMLMPSIAFAQQTTEIANPEQAGQVFALLLEAFQSKNWGLGVGAIIMLLMYAIRKIGWLDNLDPKHVKDVALGMGIASAFAIPLVAGADWTAAITQGLLAGVSSIGMWELLKERVFKKPS